MLFVSLFFGQMNKRKGIEMDTKERMPIGLCLNIQIRRSQRPSLRDWTLQDIDISQKANEMAVELGYKDWQDVLIKNGRLT